MKRAGELMRKVCSATFGALTLLVASSMQGQAAASPVVGGFASYLGATGDVFNLGGGVSPDVSMFTIGSQSTEYFTFAAPNSHGQAASTIFGAQGAPSNAGTPLDGKTTYQQVDFWNDSEASPAERNRLTWTGSTINFPVAQGALVKLGTLSFTNRSWFSSEPQLDFSAPGDPALLLYPRSEFEFLAQSLDGSIEHTWIDNLILISTRFLAGNTPEQNADYVFFEKHVAVMGSFAVREGSTGSADVYGRIGSLIPVEFRNVQGDAFLIPPAQIPEPSSSFLIAAGLIACLAGRSRKCDNERRQRAPRPQP